MAIVVAVIIMAPLMFVFGISTMMMLLALMVPLLIPLVAIAGVRILNRCMHNG